MRLVSAFLALLVILCAPARADSAGNADQAAIRGVISAQIEAFRADDGPRAYGYAAPLIRQMFPSPDIFMNMVRQGYQPVYRPRSVTFGEAGVTPSGLPTQKVTVVGPDGVTYDAIYTMQKQPDGTWQINGCTLVRVPGLAA